MSIYNHLKVVVYYRNATQYIPFARRGYIYEIENGEVVGCYLDTIDNITRPIKSLLDNKWPALDRFAMGDIRFQCDLVINREIFNRFINHFEYLCEKTADCKIIGVCDRLVPYECDIAAAFYFEHYEGNRMFSPSLTNQVILPRKITLFFEKGDELPDGGAKNVFGVFKRNMKKGKRYLTGANAKIKI